MNVPGLPEMKAFQSFGTLSLFKGMQKCTCHKILKLPGTGIQFLECLMTPSPPVSLNDMVIFSI